MTDKLAERKARQAEADKAVAEIIEAERDEVLVGTAAPRPKREVEGVMTRVWVEQPKPSWFSFARLNPLQQYYSGWVVVCHVMCSCGCTNSVGMSDAAPVPPTPDLVADYTRDATIKAMRGYTQARAQKVMASLQELDQEAAQGIGEAINQAMESGSVLDFPSPFGKPKKKPTEH